MVRKRGNRIIEYKGEVYSWYIRENEPSNPTIRIRSKSKKEFVFPLTDNDVPVTSVYIKQLLEDYFEREALGYKD